MKIVNKFYSFSIKDDYVIILMEYFNSDDVGYIKSDRKIYNMELEIFSMFNMNKIVHKKENVLKEFTQFVVNKYFKLLKEKNVYDEHLEYYEDYLDSLSLFLNIAHRKKRLTYSVLYDMIKKSLNNIVSFDDINSFIDCNFLLYKGNRIDDGSYLYFFRDKNIEEFEVNNIDIKKMAKVIKNINKLNTSRFFYIELYEYDEDFNLNKIGYYKKNDDFEYDVVNETEKSMLTEREAKTIVETFDAVPIKAVIKSIVEV